MSIHRNVSQQLLGVPFFKKIMCVNYSFFSSISGAVNRIKEIIGEALAKEAIKQPLPPVVTSTARSSPMTAHNSPFSTLPQLQPGVCMFDLNWVLWLEWIFVHNLYYCEYDSIMQYYSVRFT